MPDALETDLYELTMAASYLEQGMSAPATFSLFVRNLPPRRGFLVAAGLEACIRFLEAFRFEEADLEYLSSVGFGEPTLERLGALRFTGEVWAVPEGRIVLAGEPILEVTAPIAEAQLAETFLLNQIGLGTLLASKAARYRIAARDRVDLVDFSLRRTHGLDAGMAAARCAAMVGFAATSNVEAARVLGLTPSGTMAHSYVEAFGTEEEAFRSFATSHVGPLTFLVDTYETLQGVRSAVRVIEDLGLREPLAVRLDSGDLAALSRQARAILDESGHPEVRIFVSGGLEESDIAEMVSGGAPVDGAGIGTKMGVSADSPYLDSAYKLVEYDGRPVLKLSPMKATLPAGKQVFRTGTPFRDQIALRDEPPSDGQVALLEQVMRDGAPTRPEPGLDAARERFEADLAAIDPGALDLEAPVAPVAAVSPALEGLREKITAELAGRSSRRR